MTATTTSPRRLRIPIRLKFTITFLVLVTAVLGVITFSTASLFQDDKKVYVNGVTSMVALGTAEEARTHLRGYRERLGLYARLLLGDAVRPEHHETVARTIFDEFPELMAVVIRSGEREPVSAFNVGALEAAGVTPESLEAFDVARPLPESTHRSGTSFVRNAPLSERVAIFQMAFAQSTTDDARSSTAVVEAFLRSDTLMQLASRLSAYRQYLVDSEGSFLAHSEPSLVLSRNDAGLGSTVAGVDNTLSASVTKEFERDGVPTIGGFAAVELGGVVAGAEIPASATHLASRELMQRLLAVAVLLLVLAVLGGVIFAHRITRPMEKLSEATQTVARGEFDVRVDVRSRDEMHDLAQSFNRMAAGLERRDSELAQKQAQLVQSEKMSAFGQLGAGIAHEVKNPLAGILACAQLAADDVEPGSSVHEDLKMIEKESMRCKSIIENLLKFARQEKSEMIATDINDVLHDSIAIVNHQLELNEVRVVRELNEALPPVNGNANQLQQVFMNLMINAQQAMEGSPGEVRVSSAPAATPGMVELRFEDTGPGIPDEIQQKIFEPFFTTKPTGKGTGLGLSVSYGIIEDHRGSIRIESEPGVGTTFVIELPVDAGASVAAGLADVTAVEPAGVT